MATNQDGPQSPSPKPATELTSFLSLPRELRQQILTDAVRKCISIRWYTHYLEYDVQDDGETVERLRRGNCYVNPGPSYTMLEALGKVDPRLGGDVAWVGDNWQKGMKTNWEMKSGRDGPLRCSMVCDGCSDHEQSLW